MTREKRLQDNIDKLCDRDFKLYMQKYSFGEEED